MTSTQLALFENSPSVGTLYRVGDLVKVKRKIPQAPGLKKGDIVKIETIHPLDGSCKFWSDVTESWGYLYPGEFTLVLPSKIDSVSESIAPAEIDTESNSTNDSVSNCKAISTYRPRGTARSGEYFRFSYRDGSRMRHVHIRGGNVDSPITQAKVAEVRSLLAAGVRSAEIVEMIRGNRNLVRNPKRQPLP